MDKRRRKFLKHSIALSAAGLLALDAASALADWPEADFAETAFDLTLKRLTNNKPLLTTDNIEFIIPEIAENGAVVPFTVTSNLDGITKLAVIAEKNPVPLIIESQLSPELAVFLSARMKLAETAFVHVVAETDKACYTIKKQVKVTIGGCGG
jgi:sulfur-oxidizing protein SoxY